MTCCHRFGDSDDSEEPENCDFASLRYLPTRLVYQLKPQAQANCTGKLHHLAECQAAESLPLNLEKTVKHLTMGQDRNTLHHLNSLHLHLHLTRSATDTEVTKHAIRCFNRRWIGQRGDVFRLHPHKWSNRRNKH
ncbi:hypothetical protein AALO_G00096040 [Alosa alosa]|uniref:Uncharacterized protein n=1 Tax=Alosa alosa TaxID=278164 RepID=A0AAV6GWH8_9TELE|nr:hypothetical protein AALO_G00096040 [Alosa alosa]